MGTIETVLEWVVGGIAGMALSNLVFYYFDRRDKRR